MTPKQCSHGVPFGQHLECLDCDLVWHRSALEQLERAAIRHRKEVERLEARIADRAKEQP